MTTTGKDGCTLALRVSLGEAATSASLGLHERQGGGGPHPDVRGALAETVQAAMKDLLPGLGLETDVPAARPWSAHVRKQPLGLVVDPDVGAAAEGFHVGDLRGTAGADDFHGLDQALVHVPGLGRGAQGDADDGVAGGPGGLDEAQPEGGIFRESSIVVQGDQHRGPPVPRLRPSRSASPDSLTVGCPAAKGIRSRSASSATPVRARVMPV